MEVGPSWESFTGLNDYDYDDIYQLTAVDSPEFSSYSDATFTYDSMGNRLTVFSGQTETYSSNNLNQYSSVGGTSYSHEGNGNLTDDGVQTYYYDFENRMTKVVRNSDGQTLAEYRYDPFGRRAKKIVHIPEERTVNYLYDGPQVIEERDGNWTLQARYVYGAGIDEPLLLQKNGQNYFYQRDALGTITEIVDSAYSGAK